MKMTDRQRLKKSFPALVVHYLSPVLKMILVWLFPLFHWKEDKKSPFGGYFEFDTPFSPGVKWRSYITRKYWIFVPLDNMPLVKHVHYSHPFPVGIWFHRTVIWENGRKTHDRFGFKAAITLRILDIAKDYVGFKKKICGREV